MSKLSSFSIDELNKVDDERAVRFILPLIERSPQIAEKIVSFRPFANSFEIIDALNRCIREQSYESTIDLLCAHPELADINFDSMTPESKAEQSRMHLSAADTKTQNILTHLNGSYGEKFGFPFIIALYRYSSIDDVIKEFERRLDKTLDEELNNALIEILSVSSARLAKAIAPEQKDKQESVGISIHAYDISNGKPAEYLEVEIVKCSGEEKESIARGEINKKGEFDYKYSLGDHISVGRYIAYFKVGAFYERLYPLIAHEKFIDVVTYEFTIADDTQHYHLPFKFTPWGFSLFRGGV